MSRSEPFAHIRLQARGNAWEAPNVEAAHGGEGDSDRYSQAEHTATLDGCMRWFGRFR